MSFALPAIKTKPEVAQSFGLVEGSFGVPDVMTNGLASVRANLESLHPVEQAQLNYRKNQDSMNMAILRNTQGLHAPLRIGMELKSVRKIGHLPFLPSSNILLESLTGRDLELMPEDCYNQPEFREVVGQPHAVMERSLGLL